jgi:hypothetical protein
MYLLHLQVFRVPASVRGCLHRGAAGLRAFTKPNGPKPARHPRSGGACIVVGPRRGLAGASSLALIGRIRSALGVGFLDPHLELFRIGALEKGGHIRHEI